MVESTRTISFVSARKPRVTAATRRRLRLRQEFWPDLEDEAFWNRKNFTGFTTIPRTIPLIMLVVDQLDTKNAGRVYFDLWCRAFDDYIVELKDESEAAFASGYIGQRAVRSWRERMDIIEEYGFVRIKKGPNGTYRYIALLDPHLVIEDLKCRGLVSEKLFDAYRAQMIEIGAV